MNNQRIIDWIDGLFAGYAQTDKVREQKEELQTHITDRVIEHMADHIDFDRAFEMAKDDLGDLNELLTGFERKKAKKKSKAIERNYWEREVIEQNGNGPATYEAHGEVIDEPRGKKKKKKKDDWDFHGQHGLVALSPFIFIAMGFVFNAWAWAWMIIPISAILCSGSWGKGGDKYKIVALSPFIYIALGFAFGWWAWGWIIIPVSCIVFSDGMGFVKD